MLNFFENSNNLWLQFRKENPFYLQINTEIKFRNKIPIIDDNYA